MGQSIGTLFPLRFRLWLGRKLYKPLDSCVVRVSRHRVIKGPCGPPEVEAMQFISENTFIPIPRVYAIHTPQDHKIYIEMEYVQGETLETAWKAEGHLSQDQKVAIFADIKEYVSVLRELKPPAEDLVGSAFANPVYDARIGARFFGPFNHQNFHSLTRSHLRMADVANVLGPEVLETHSASYRTVFTHADLVPRNIIVKDGRVAAIIDWGFAGWYPEYWEFTKGHFDFFPEEDWLSFFRGALPNYHTELEAERALWEILPDPGTPFTAYRDGVVRERPGSEPSQAWRDARVCGEPNDLWAIALSSSRYSKT